MKPRYIFLLILLLLVVPFASATIINTTQFGASSAGTYHTDAASPGQTVLYNPSPTGEKYAIIQTTFKLTNDNTILKTTYTLKSGASIVVDTASVTTGIFTAEYRVTNSNGKIGVIPYTLWLPWSGSNAPDIQTRILYSNTTGLWYLYTALQSDTGNPLDDSTASFAIIDSPVANPIASVTQSVNSGGSLQVTYLSIPAAELSYDSRKTIESAASGGVTTSLPESLLRILDSILKTLTELSNILGKTVGFLNITTAFFVFLTASEIFVGINVLYIAIAILLSIEDSDDIFRAYGQFHRRMMKLFRFYMELFRGLKDIIKWW